MSIKSDVNELSHINVEIKRLSGQLRNLRQKAKDVEERIIAYLKEREQPGVKYQGTAIVLENKPKRMPKKVKDRHESAISVLRNCEVDDPESVLKQILEAQRGDFMESSKLKIRHLERY